MPPNRKRELALSRDVLRAVLSYEPHTGRFRWNWRPGKAGNSVVVGSVAGALNVHGYRRIKVNGRLYMAHRLAWFYTHGEWPYPEIDHINLNKDDNRIANLRRATPADNCRNSPKRAANTTGLKGVVRRGKKWLAQINARGKRLHLGMFTTPEAAHAAYCAAAQKYYGEFARKE
jgi:hypothetical protein